MSHPGVMGLDLGARLALRVALGSALIYLAFTPPAMRSFDSHSMLAVTESLVTRGDVTVPASLGQRGVDGRHYSAYYPLLSAVAVPFVFVGRAVGAGVGVPPHYAAAAGALVLPGLLVAATNGLVALVALQLGSTPWGAWLAALAFRGTAGALGAAAATTALAVRAKPPGVIVGPIIAGYFLARRRPVGVVLLPLIGSAVGATLYLAYNQARFGDPSRPACPGSSRSGSFPRASSVTSSVPARGSCSTAHP